MGNVEGSSIRSSDDAVLLQSGERKKEAETMMAVK